LFYAYEYPFLRENSRAIFPYGNNRNYLIIVSEVSVAPDKSTQVITNLSPATAPLNVNLIIGFLDRN
jgi:hypothetical protein